MFKKFLKLIAIFLFVFSFGTVDAASSDAGEGFNYTTIRTIDLKTFNEYRYRITSKFFKMRDYFELNGKINTSVANDILDIAKIGYNYLPDSLANKNNYQKLETALKKGIKYPNNESSYDEIKAAIQAFLDDVKIEKIKGRIVATPKEGNAPLTVTLRADVTDPTGSQIQAYNYVWWINDGGKRKIIGKKPSMNYTLKNEGNFSIFLDVTSSHKNTKGYTDVLPFRSRVDIEVKEKIASLIIKVNSDYLRQKDVLKFLPQEASYGLLFDATSSTPTSGTKFTRTEWDFGNGVERKYDGPPKIERVTYNKTGEYTVRLKLRTNEGKTIERKFRISVYNPIATIQTTTEEGFLGDKITFSAKTIGNEDNLSYDWEIIDLEADKVVFRKSGSLFSYSFQEKGKYNVRLQVKEPSGEVGIDTQVIYINSRPPQASFQHSIPFPNKPNMVLLDGSKSYDPDSSDDGKLEYNWIIDGERVKLEDPNFNGSVGYYTFDSTGDRSVVLEVVDPDQINSRVTKKVTVDSLLSVDFSALPRVSPIGRKMRFLAESSQARFYEWDFGDGVKVGGKDKSIFHAYKKAGTYKVKLKVIDKDDNENTYSKNVYVSDANAPFAYITMNSPNSEIIHDKDACDGKGAYVINRNDSFTFSADESIDVTGENTGLQYSWKFGKDVYYSSRDFSRQFEDLGCYPLKLTVTSDKTGKSHSTSTFVEIQNLKPTIGGIDIQVKDETTDPVVVNLRALGAKDLDKNGRIQSYLWYYYTDLDSEPQDFRATKTPDTTFVLPKVTGNYYFVVIMKDNNEARVNSEEATGSKYFITLTGDNINIPIIDLGIEDNSVAVGDEVVLSAQAKNILGENITKKSVYYWDIDGDGYYEKETKSNSISYKFPKAGEYHARVKVKYKGYSNTKSVGIAVSNNITPDFDYISIGDKVIFIDKSLGQIDQYHWNLGDGNIVKNKQMFIHTYEDGKSPHSVTLKITEGTKQKEISKKVSRNIRNSLSVRTGKDIVYFTFPKVQNDTIVLSEEQDQILIYMGESKGDIHRYIIDEDISIDSDINGGEDDDIDNKDDSSYKTGLPYYVQLNNNKTQVVRMVLRDSSDEIIATKDITIQKEYITQETSVVEIENIEFEGISESTKLKIEKIKALIDKLPSKDKLKAALYIQTLQSEWFDDREKTKTIIEFEAYINSLSIENSEKDQINNLLESLLVEGQEDKSEKSITFNALKNLVPKSILCGDANLDVFDENKTATKCYYDIVEKLEAIRDNGDVEENRVLGSSILDVIALDTAMSDLQKNDFKAILKTLVYGGVTEIPEEEIKEVIEDNKEQSGSSKFVSVLKVIAWGVLGFMFFIVVLLFLFFIFFKLSNKDENIGFQDFIIDKTSGNKNNNKEVKTQITEDIFDDIIENKEETKQDKKTEKQSDIFRSVESSQPSKIEKVKETKEVEKQSHSVENAVSQSSEENNVPDWLQGAAKSSGDDLSKTEKKSEQNSKEELDELTKVDDAEIPDWLQGSKKQAPKGDKQDSKPKNEPKSSVQSTTQDADVPDWLKGSFESSEENKTSNDSKTENIKQEAPKTVEKREENSEKTKNSEIKNDKSPAENKPQSSTTQDADIPDWLKGSFEEQPNDNKKVSEQPKENTKKAVTEKNNGDTQTETKNPKKTPKKQEPNTQAEKVEKPKIAKKPANTTKQTEKQTDKKTKPNTDKSADSKKTKKTTSGSKAIDKKVVEFDLQDDSKKTSEQREKQKTETKTTKQKTKSDADDELWDDGMQIPDWLQSDDKK